MPLMLPWQPIFDKQFFQKIGNPFFKMKKNHFSGVTVYCPFIGFDHFLFYFGTFLKFWENSDILDLRWQIQGGCRLAIMA